MHIELFWQAFITEYPAFASEKYTAWAFGVDQTELAQLVCSGQKTATTSAYDDYLIDGDTLPQVGELSVVLDGEGEPRCVIQTTEVYHARYGDITAEHAYLEGEGDRTLAYWYKAHDAFFKPLFESWGKTLHEDCIMVCERFECLYVRDM